MITRNDPQNTLQELRRQIVTGPGAVTNAVERAALVGSIWSREREALLPVLNATTNTIDANLKRVSILQETVRAFALRVLPLRLFCTSFVNTPLRGTDEVVVPYFPLQADVSTDFNPANGYVFNGNTNSSSKKITVNKRKYQGLDYSSAEFRRQPFFDSLRLSVMNAEKLAYDVLVDIFSAITAGNFGAAVKNLPEAAFTSDDIEDIRVACNDAHWPDQGRSLVVNTAVDGALHKDPAYKLALNIGGTEAIREGKFPRLAGFDYAFMPGLPENGENLVGFAAYMSAILAAFAPVQPADGVRSQLVSYDVITDTLTGISLNYRHWGNAQMDRDAEVIECAYGYAVGEAAALKRLTKP